MGKKKILVIFVLVFVLFIGWILALKAVTHIDDIKKQEKLVEQANSFKERGLYVRAIPLYEEAMGINTKEKRLFEIETALKDTYLLHGDYVKYVKIVEKRADNNTATVDDYATAFNYHIENYETEDAFKLIKKGIENTNDDSLKKLYEDHRYTYRLASSKYMYIAPTANNGVMPVYDGEKWGYINHNGGTVIPAVYDEATAFSQDGIAAVYKDGKYYAITTEGDHYGVDDNPNTSRIQEVIYTFGTYIVAKKDGKYGIFDYDFNQVLPQYTFDEITRASSGMLVGKVGSDWKLINLEEGKEVLSGVEEVAVNSYGSVFYDDRGMVKQGGKWYLVDKMGNRVIETGFDDARAPESLGYIAVANNAERWGFINRNGELVIEYQYLDAYSFSDEVAAVQNYEKKWMYVSKLNVPISEEGFDAAAPFHNGVGQVYTDGIASLIIFEYYGQ